MFFDKLMRTEKQPANRSLVTIRPGRNGAPTRQRDQAAVVLAGFESAGKTAVFRFLTGALLSDEANFRGSTVFCRRGDLPDTDQHVVDTPGIRFEGDSVTTRLALSALDDADVVLLVVRATHASAELSRLVDGLAARLTGRRVAVLLTFEDRAAPGLEAFVRAASDLLAVPVMAVNARRGGSAKRDAVLALARAARALPESVSWARLPRLAEAVAPPSLFEKGRGVGPALAAAAVLLMYGFPVYLAYALSQAAQPVLDVALIVPMTSWLEGLLASWPLLGAILIGNYGVLTLGWYSFLWAFPVVALLGASVAITDEIGLKDGAATGLEPWLRRIGLDGRDLTPLLTGFGCNVVAVVQSRACGACTRRECVSLIAYGAACSYQMGAALSLFGTAGKPWLFFPYLATLFAVGAAHTRLWRARAGHPESERLGGGRAFLQAPSWRGMAFKLGASARQFLTQAMPTFLVVCVVAALLSHVGALDRLADAIAPVLRGFRLPGEVAHGLVFSILRKDGLLVLNEGGGAVLRQLNAGQVFVVVYLGSTLTACLVTLWTVRRELGLRFAITLFARQAATAIVSALVLAWGFAVLIG